MLPPIIARKQVASIHAPARGATTHLSAMRDNWAASIHAPARGATPLQGCCICDMQASIHAPARGATCPILPLHNHPISFNPRSRTGSDLR